MSELLWTSLKLGSTSFGGPIAHLAYFERVYVRERQWLDGAEYGGLLALCQLLPGPTSSQVNFLVGWRRAGWLGALAAWFGFTLPSALLMYAFAVFAPHATGPVMSAAFHGLMLTAVAVVAQALSSMARTLCPDRRRLGIALLAAVLVIFRSSVAMQLAAMLLGALGGWLLCQKTGPPNFSSGVLKPGIGAAALVLFFLLLLGLTLTAKSHGPTALASIFYRAGALVFGGGHVVLPLLRDALVPSGWISDPAFLSGYGLAQAMPGPLFTVSAYLGAAAAPPQDAALWAVVALIAMFLPGMLLAIAGQSLWSHSSRMRGAHPILAGINASVVGILAAALYDPIWINSVHDVFDAVVALCGFLLLLRWKLPPIVVVCVCVAASIGVTVVST